MYAAKNPAIRGPRPSPVMLVPVATTAAAWRSPRGWNSASAAVAVPVANPAARPLTIRATMSSPMPGAARNSPVLTAAHTTAIASTFLRPIAHHGDRQHLPAADMVAQVAESHQREQRADDIGGEDHGDPERAEAHLLLIQHIERYRQSPAEHHTSE